MTNEDTVQTSTTETATGQTSTETAPVSSTVEQTPQSVPPAVPEDYKAKFSASTAENQRLRAALEQQQREAIQLRQIMSTQVQPQTVQQPQIPDDSAIYNQLTDSMLDRNVDGMKRHDRYVVEQAKREILGEMQGQTAQQSRIQASLAYIAPVFSGGDTPLAQATLANYTRMINDPNYIHTVEPAQIQVPGTTIAINPHVMRDAAKEAKLQMLEKGGNATLTARKLDTDGPEPAAGAQNTDVKPKFDSRTHLTEDEREYCASSGTKYETYWKYMKDDIKEERLSSGKATPRKRK